MSSAERKNNRSCHHLLSFKAHTAKPPRTRVPGLSEQTLWSPSSGVVSTHHATVVGQTPFLDSCGIRTSHGKKTVHRKGELGAAQSSLKPKKIFQKPGALEPGHSGQKRLRSKVQRFSEWASGPLLPCWGGLSSLSSFLYSI